MSEQKPENEKQERSKSSNTDLIPWFYYAGMVMVFTGMTIHYSFAIALIAVGAFITLVSLINSYLLLWLSR
jgi:hypothetical protein